MKPKTETKTKETENMAKKEWKEVKSGNFNPMVNVKEKVGTEVEGIYKGSKQVDRDQGDPSTVHTIEMSGADFDFWGTGQLNALLKAVEIGTTIKIVYQGLVKAKVEINGKKMNKEVHNFQLFTA